MTEQLSHIEPNTTEAARPARSGGDRLQCYSRAMRAALAALAGGKMSHYARSGGFRRGDVVVAGNTMRALAVRGLVAFDRRLRHRVAALTPAGRELAAEIVAAEADALAE